jgi:hypothetical protein
MYSTTVHIERPEGTVIASGLAAQIDQAEPLPARDERGHRDALRWWILLQSVPTAGVQRRDIVQDERTIDPLTGANARFRVVAVEAFESDHVEALCEQVIGD